MIEMFSEYRYWLFWGFLVLCLVWFYLHHRKRVRAFLLGGITGLTALLLLHSFGGSIGLTIPLNTGNLALSALLGIPGTGLIVAAQFL